MSPDQLRITLRTAPFTPFRVHLVDQRTFDVPHPEFAWMVPSGRTLYVVGGSLDAAEAIDVSLIVSLAPIDGSSSGARAA